MKTSIYIAISVDGYIARQDGSLEWLSSGNEDETQDFGFHTFLDSVDALVMGRNTFEKILSFDTWVYGSKPIFVLSSRNLKIPDHLADSVARLSGSPVEIVNKLQNQGFTHLYIDGGKTIQGFLSAGLIDEMTISIIPVIIGNGIPLFGPIPEDIHLDLIHSHLFNNGIVQNIYHINKEK